MTGHLFLNSLFGLLPVVAFLATIAHFDSFKLVRSKSIFQTMVAGALAAILAYFVNTYLLVHLEVSFDYFTHFVSPLVEEGLKAALVIALLRTNRIGFMFDAVILGFSIGAGFALVENLYYLKSLGLEHPAVWVIRGFGSAIMHGGVTAIFAIAAHLLTLRGTRPNPILLAPGFIFAITLHSGFNFFLDFPVSSTIAMIAMLAAALSLSLARDRRSIHEWIEDDFDRHRRLLDALNKGDFESFRLGRLFAALADRGDHLLRADLVECVKVRTELVLEAEEILLAHERGETRQVSAETRGKLERLVELERKIGKSALMFLNAHLGFGRHDLWELYMLEKETGAAHPHVHVA